MVSKSKKVEEGARVSWRTPGVLSGHLCHFAPLTAIFIFSLSFKCSKACLLVHVLSIRVLDIMVEKGTGTSRGSQAELCCSQDHLFYSVGKDVAVVFVIAVDGPSPPPTLRGGGRG